jgi:hypothetical protein
MIFNIIFLNLSIIINKKAIEKIIKSKYIKNINFNSYIKQKPIIKIIVLGIKAENLSTNIINMFLFNFILW